MFQFYDMDGNVDVYKRQQYYHAFSDIYKVPMSDQIFVAQSNVIRRLAAHGPCVIVGRCADMILDDSINLFIYSKMRDRIKRMLILEPGSDEKEMERRIREVDRKRKEYYPVSYTHLDVYKRQPLPCSPRRSTKRQRKRM